MKLLRIKPVDSDQLPILRELSISTFMHSFAHFNSEANMTHYMSRAFSEDKLLKELLHPNSAFYLAQVESRFGGYMKLNTGSAQSDLSDQNALEVERIYIDAEFQGNGLGSQLMQFAIDSATESEKDFIWLGVWEHNAKAISFYKKLGFYQFDSHPFMLGDDRQIDLLFRLDI